MGGNRCWIALGGDQYRQTVTLTQDPRHADAARAWGQPAGRGVSCGRLRLADPGVHAHSECDSSLTLPVIPICYVRSRNASNYLNLNLVYDVFPATERLLQSRAKLSGIRARLGQADGPVWHTPGC